MYKLLLGFKLILYGLVFVRVFERTPLSPPLVLLAVALVVSGFWRNLDEYRRPKVNLYTMHLDLLLAFLFSLLSDRGSFDKLFIVYLVEGVMVLPKPYFVVYSLITLAFSFISTSLYELRVEGGLIPPSFAQVLLYGFILALVLSERLQREQRIANEKLTAELKYVNLQLKESIAWSEALSSEAERRRIAGEIHDSLGHDLTGLILTLEAGKKLIERDAEAGMVYWDKALQVSRSAIGSVRDLVSGAGEPGPEFGLGSRLLEMARGVEELTGLKIELEIEAGDMGLSKKEQFNLYRVFQEAVTNTLRHSGAEHAYIKISRDENQLCFTYRDDGRGTEEINEGNGLKGMVVRVREIGGDISFQPGPGSDFRIEGSIGRRGEAR